MSATSQLLQKSGIQPQIDSSSTGTGGASSRLLQSAKSGTYKSPASPYSTEPVQPAPVVQQQNPLQSIVSGVQRLIPQLNPANQPVVPVPGTQVTPESLKMGTNIGKPLISPQR